jgi:hypothetical protein
VISGENPYTIYENSVNEIASKAFRELSKGFCLEKGKKKSTGSLRINRLGVLRDSRPSM